MSFYWRRLPRGGDASDSTTLSLSLSLFPPSPPNDFKVVAGNRFANPWRRRIGAFRTPAPRFHFAHNSTSTLSLFPPLVIYNRFSPFFAPTILCPNPVHRVNSFPLHYCLIIIWIYGDLDAPSLSTCAIPSSSF